MQPRSAASPSETTPRHEPGRVHERACLRAEVTMESDHNFFTGFSENISEGGLFVATHQLQDIGTDLVLEFSVPDRATPIRATCRVRWVRLYRESSDAPPGMGVEFIDLDGHDAADISRFVTRRAPLFWD